MAILAIGPEEQAAIERCIAEAEARPLSAAEIERRIKEGQPPSGQRNNPTIQLPVGYGVSFTIEEQSWGWARHISISVDRPGKLPSIEAINFILAAFHFVNRVPRIPSFIERVAVGHEAINLIEPKDGDIEKMIMRH